MCVSCVSLLRIEFLEDIISYRKFYTHFSASFSICSSNKTIVIIVESNRFIGDTDQIDMRVNVGGS